MVLNVVHTLATAYQNKLGPEETEAIQSVKYKAREDGSTMKALVWYKIHDVRVVEVPIPDITEDNDVVLKVTGTTICGSDLHLYDGEIFPLEKGDILGHEFMGVIDRVGPNVKTLKVGQRVVTSFQISCGKCRYCQKKLSSQCERTNPSSLQGKLWGTQAIGGAFGYSHITGGFAGGQAEYVRVPLAEVDGKANNVLPVPDDVPDDKALYLSDILGTAYHNVVDTGVSEGDTVAIWGLGPIGQCAAKWAKIKGAKRVIGIDKVAFRLQMAQEKTGIETIDFSKDTDVVKKLLELVPGGVDVSLDCGTFHEPKSIVHKVEKALMLETDVPETVNEMIKATRKMGRIGIIADYVGFANHVNIGGLMEKGLRVIGNGQSPTHLYWEEILDKYIKTDVFAVKDIVTHRVPIDDFAELYKAFSERREGIMKVFVETKFSSPPSKGFPKVMRANQIGVTKSEFA